MYSREDSHIEAYKQWAGVKGRTVQVADEDGESKTIQIPTIWGKPNFFSFGISLSHMYFRYFMWNFAGRQSDIQSHGEITNGNWICGINAIDSIRLGDQSSPTK